MFGLWIAGEGSTDEAALRELLKKQMIPFEGFTDEQPAFVKGTDREDFLRKAIAAVMQGLPLPMADVAEYLSTPVAAPGNVLRKYVCLQLSLLPYLRVNSRITWLEGCFLLGGDLLIAPLGEDGRVDALLPDGVWTELSTGECFTGRLRRIRGLNAMPVLARENSVIPIGVDDRRTDAEDADRVTLQWFQPGAEARCVLSEGTEYRLTHRNGAFTGESMTDKTWHLIVRQSGEERLIR
ncbi:MAG: hypothetical protein E7316_01300 [Clostridiales bacterium]|nr:hypothetical protein [Clostridiales bacterium]